MLIHLFLLLIGLLAIGAVLFMHELGHFLVARLFKVDVEILSYGLGPALFSYHGKRTEYRISLIPFGGYCRMSGSLDLTKALQDGARSVEKAEAGSYFSAAPWKRFLIYLAGPMANFIIAAALIAISSMIPVERLSDEAIVTPIYEYSDLFGSDIIQKGIMKGDRLLSSGDKAFIDWQDAEDFLERNSGHPIPLTVLRGDRIIETELVPCRTDDGWAYGIALLQRPVIGRSTSEEYRDGDIIRAIDGNPVSSTYDIYSYGKKDFTLTIERDGELIERHIEDGRLPFAWKSGIRIAPDSGTPLRDALGRCIDLFRSTLAALGAFVTFHFEDALEVLTGPVKAAESIGSITMEAFTVSERSGYRSILQLLAIISISLSAGNMLPIPTFDGGQMLITLTEMIRRKALAPRTYVILQIAGMILALAIMAAMYALDFRSYLLS